MKENYILVLCMAISFLTPFFVSRDIKALTSGSAVKTEIESQVEMKRETGTETDKESKTEKDTESQTEKDTESYTETESETETETESEIESETETARIIEVESVKIAYDKNTRAYDGTDLVDLKVVTKQSVKGDVQVLAVGRSEDCKVGFWTVDVSYKLTGNDAKSFQLETKAVKLKVHIVPKILKVEIADASKEYFTETKVRNLEFEDGIPKIQITGFIENGRLTQKMPKGFVMPELEVDTAILKKDSPMYTKGKVKVYLGALVLKTGKDGKISGKTTENYCYDLGEKSDFYKKGNIVLYAAKNVPEQQYQVTVEGGGIWREGETYWIQKGSRFVVTPLETSGFNEIILSEPMERSGEFTYTFRQVDNKGNLKSCSEAQQIFYQIDDKPPEFTVYLNGLTKHTNYSKNSVRVSISEIKDLQSGMQWAGCFVSSRYYSDEELKAGIQKQEVIWETWKNEITITKEGEYYFYAGGIDRVGNVAVMRSAQFIIDKKAPVIQINGVKDKSSNAGKVSIEISFQDINLSKDMLQAVIRGNQGKTIPLSCEKVQKKNKIVWLYEDFPQYKAMDDLYTLEAEAQDEAGNKVRKTVTFSINRFGSVFVLSEETKEHLKQFYIQTPPSVTIREINVDVLKKNTITVVHNGDMKQLKESKDYTLSQKNGEYNWQEYEYRISKNCFDEEGLYTVILSSEDAAHNLGDIRKEQGNLEFFIDKTPPSCVISGIEQNETYIEKEKEVTIAVNDNGYLQSVRVLLNGSVLLEGKENQYSITVKSEDHWQTLQVFASDKAGNEIWTNEINFLLLASKKDGSQQKSKSTGQTQKAGQEEEIQETAQLSENINQEEMKQKNMVKPFCIVLVLFGIVSMLLFSLKKMLAK